MEIRRDILWRVYISFLGITVLSLLVLGRAVYIQRFQGNYWRSMSDSIHQRIQSLDAVRGTIYSEDGQMLSASIPTFDIRMDFQADGLVEKKGKVFRENIDSFAKALAGFFNDKSAAQYKNELNAAFKKGDRYYLLKKKLSFEEYKEFRQFPLVRLGKNKSGVIVETDSKRLVPFGLLANRTIGLSREYIGDEGKVRKQNVGLEKSYDTVLSGRNGQRLVRRIAGGGLIPVEGSQTDPIQGKDIVTNIDINIQDIAETALMKMMLQCEGPYGTAIVMETQTGKIKAIANLGRQPDGSYYEDDNYALKNTEPGSTIKLVTLLSVLEKGTSSPDDMIEVGSAGRMQVGKKIVTDAERSPRSSLSVMECFAHSSNVGMSKLAYKAFAKKPVELKDYMQKFHLNRRAQIDLTDLPKPLMAPLDQKGSAEGNMLWMSFGYGISISPIHTLTLYNAIANNGKMMKPYLVNSIQDNGILLKQFQPTVIDEKLCKSSVVETAKKSMEMVVTEGTARRAFAGLPFKVAGKTGTAHVSDGKIKYDHGVYQATFVGYFPADNPQYTCIVVIRTKPHAASHYGGTLAAPVFREIATRLYAMYVEKKEPSMYAVEKDQSPYFYSGNSADIKNVYTAMHISYADSASQSEWANVYEGNSQPVIRKSIVRQQVMPNVKGMGLKDAVWLLENMGMKISIKGSGKIINQSVEPGSALKKGDTIILELS
ncbi:MAG TPA: penicillin-binding protein [Chitinophagaceae bacterium]|nr:penicillin-binding protein [Chitinophagaceae bacterium]